jgi:hypothetical protein
VKRYTQQVLLYRPHQLAVPRGICFHKASVYARQHTAGDLRSDTTIYTRKYICIDRPCPYEVSIFQSQKEFCRPTSHNYEADLRVTIMKLVTSYWARKHRRKAYRPCKLCQKQSHLCPGCGLPVQKIGWHRSLWHCIFCFVLIVTLTMHGQPEESKQQYE